MNLSLWAIRRPVPPLAACLVLCVVGLVAFKQLPVSVMPNVDIPLITVDVALQGAAPTELMSQVTKPVEDRLSSIPGVDHIASTVMDSHSQTIVQFSLDTQSDEALSDVQDAMTQTRSELPDSISEPLVQLMDVSGGAIIHYAISDDTLSIEALSFFVDDVIVRALQGVRGVGQVSRFGGAEREIKIELDPARLLALDITASDVSSQLLASHASLTGGRASMNGREMSIRTLGASHSLEELANLNLALPDGRTLRLSDVGRIVDGAAETRSFAMLDGKSVVSIGVFRSTGASELTTATGVTSRIAELRKEYPTLEMKKIYDTSTYTAGNFSASMNTLYEGAILAIVVVLIFLRNWRATIITALALPLSIIPTFFVMHALGFSLNTVSLLGITLVTGILVDDAIVEIENITRHIQAGKTPYVASKEAATEIGLTVVAISLTIVAVFAPVSFMGGIIGQYFRQFGLTVSIAVLFSLLVARMITPMLAAYFMQSQSSNAEASDGSVMRTYLRVLRWTLRHRTLTLCAGIIVFAVSLFSATLLPSDFVPASDEGRSTLTLELPPGSLLEDTSAVARQVSEQVLSFDEVQNVHVTGGTDAVTKATLLVNYVPKNEREYDSFAMENRLRDELLDVPDVKLNVLGPSGERAISINVLGKSLSSASAAAEQLAAEMRTLPELVNVDTVTSQSKPEIRITPKPALAAELGVTASTLASTLRVATLGDGSDYLAKYSDGSQQLPIVVRLKASVRHNLTDLASLRIPSTTGRTIPLGVVADITFAEGPGSIESYDRQYRVAVVADLADGEVLGPAMNAIHQTQTSKNMPEGTSLQAGGDAEVMSEMFTSFGLAMGLGVLLVYVVLVILFDSFITPITILLSLPLCIGGAIIALYITDNAISLAVVIGFLMLMGIVTKNAIMLVEFALQGLSRGLTTHQAILEAGHKRARPIIMTTIAMVAGMIPSALSVGEGGEFRSPMAIAVIGGLLLSTLLSLVFVPSVFSVVNALKQRARRWLVSLQGPNQALESVQSDAKLVEVTTGEPVMNNQEMTTV